MKSNKNKEIEKAIENAKEQMIAEIEEKENVNKEILKITKSLPNKVNTIKDDMLQLLDKTIDNNTAEISDVAVRKIITKTKLVRNYKQRINNAIKNTKELIDYALKQEDLINQDEEAKKNASIKLKGFTTIDEGVTMAIIEQNNTERLIRIDDIKHLDKFIYKQDEYLPFNGVFAIPNGYIESIVDNENHTENLVYKPTITEKILWFVKRSPANIAYGSIDKHAEEIIQIIQESYEDRVDDEVEPEGIRLTAEDILFNNRNLLINEANFNANLKYLQDAQRIIEKAQEKQRIKKEIRKQQPEKSLMLKLLEQAKKQQNHSH